ncbi:MAG TPA: hypothetical protein VLW75_01250, partial [Rhizomicrobium sp.]|nr:hypothetical protein [Rhizomicrobium sp.]
SIISAKVACSAVRRGFSDDRIVRISKLFAMKCSRFFSGKKLISALSAKAELDPKRTVNANAQNRHDMFCIT